MNRIIAYCLILLSYLVLSKSLSPFEFGIQYVKDRESLHALVKGAPVSAILIDQHTTGFAIKTYYLKFKIVYGFESYEELVVRSSSQLAQDLAPYLGLSIFSRDKKGNINNTPTIPGAIFIGNKTYGSWINSDDKKVWKFFRVYRQIPAYLGWGDFLPTIEEYNLIELNKKQNKPFRGTQNQFGPNGAITKASFPDFFARKNKKVLTWQDFLQNYFNENFINYKEQL